MAEIFPALSKISNCDSKSAFNRDTIHRGVRSTYDRDVIDLVRLPSENYSFEDVDIVVRGNNFWIVASGRNQGHKDGGISIQGYDDNSIHDSGDGQYKREVLMIPFTAKIRVGKFSNGIATNVSV